MRRPEGRRYLSNSIATFPERYGDNLIQIALDILHGKPVPPAVYAPIQLVTPQSINKFYASTLFTDKEL